MHVWLEMFHHPEEQTVMDLLRALSSFVAEALRRQSTNEITPYLNAFAQAIQDRKAVLKKEISKESSFSSTPFPGVSRLLRSQLSLVGLGFSCVHDSNCRCTNTGRYGWNTLVTTHLLHLSAYCWLSRWRSLTTSCSAPYRKSPTQGVCYKPMYMCWSWHQPICRMCEFLDKHFTKPTMSPHFTEMVVVFNRVCCSFQNVATAVSPVNVSCSGVRGLPR